MTPGAFLDRIIDPGLEVLAWLGGPEVNGIAKVMLLAIAQQESGRGLEARYQGSPGNVPGPARGWWQFEQGGGVAGVMAHRATKDLAHKACDHFSVVKHNAAVWRALEGHDLLAACFARLLLYSDPMALPTTEEAGWAFYLRNWRPGKPHASAWPRNWMNASQAVNGE